MRKTILMTVLSFSLGLFFNVGAFAAAPTGCVPSIEKNIVCLGAPCNLNGQTRLDGNGMDIIGCLNRDATGLKWWRINQVPTRVGSVKLSINGLNEVLTSADGKCTDPYASDGLGVCNYACFKACEGLPFHVGGFLSDWNPGEIPETVCTCFPGKLMNWP